MVKLRLKTRGASYHEGKEFPLNTLLTNSNILQMRDATTHKIVGMWENNDIAKGVDCNGEAGNDTLTHKDSSKNKVFLMKLVVSFNNYIQLFRHQDKVARL